MRPLVCNPRRPDIPALAALFIAVSAAASLVSACDGKEKDVAPTKADSAASSAPTASPASVSVKDTSLGSARVLALAKPSGTPLIDKQIELFQQRAKELPRKADPWILLGQAWIRKARQTADPGYYLNANACADIVLDMQKDDRLALNLRAIVLVNEHKFAEARDVAEQILAKEPEDIMALGTLSDALLEVGRFKDAAQAAQKMMDLKPNLPSYTRAAYFRWLQGDIEGAKIVIRQAIDARDPSDPEPGAWAIVQAGLIFWHLGDYGGADKGFDLALQVMSDYAPALVGKGRVALAEGRPERAVELLTKAYKASPLVETAWLLGDAKEAAGDAAGAAETYALVVKTGRQMDGRTLALFYATKNRDVDEARKLAEAEMKIRPDIYTQDTYAWALYRAGKLAEARAASDASIALGTKDARLLYHAGAIRVAAKDRAAGEKLVKEALKLNPRFDRTGSAEAEKLVSGASTVQ